MTITQDPIGTGWSGRPLMVDAVVLSEEQIARAAHCSHPEDSDEAAWDRYLRALALEGLKGAILGRKAAITIGPELEPEAPARLLAVNGLATQLLCCTDLAERIEVDLAPWRQQATAPQMLLAMQVDEDNGMVRVAGVMEGPAFVARITEEGQTLSAATAELPVAVFTGRFEQFLRWATMLPTSALPRVAVPAGSGATPRGIAKSLQELQAQVDGWVKRLLQESPAPIPLLVIGARAADRAEVCLINPQVELDAEGNPIAVALSSTPTIWADRPLAEILIERDGFAVWQQLATSRDPIEGAIAWPLEHLAPSEHCTVKLRPYGALGGSYVRVSFVTANSETLRKSEECLSHAKELKELPATEELGLGIDNTTRLALEFAARLQLKHG